jgi:hypothetical protein
MQRKKLHLKGRHSCIFRYQRSLVSKAGYSIPPDSLQLEKAGSFYLGNPDRYYLKYQYQGGDLLRAGITTEKDPGELFLSMPEQLEDSLSRKLKSERGFDFYSAHFEVRNLGPIKKVILGDFHMQCGQGLVLWSGLSFNGGSSPTVFKRYAPVLRASTSANENLFMRGLAARVRWHNIDFSLFFSRKSVDANIEISGPNDDVRHVGSMPESGYHRTLNELNNKHALVQQHYGGHILYSHDRFRIGFTAFQSMMNLSISGDEAPSKKFNFAGKKNINAGMNYDILLRNTSIYGELGYSINGGWALLSGLTHTTRGGSIVSILFHEYRKEYQNFLAGAMGDRDNNANERGLRLAIECPLHRSLTLLVYSEHMTYPWLTTRNINVFRGQEHALSLFFIPGDQSRMQLRYKFKNGIIKSSENITWLDEMLHQHRHQLRLQINHEVSPGVSIKCQLEHMLVVNDGPESKSKGSLLLLDVFYHPPEVPVKLSLRYAIFNTDDYNSRLYAYEHDVLYASSMPAYYGKGFRTYFLLSYKATQWIQFWLRFSLTNFTDRHIISSGTEKVRGNKLPEIKIQMRLKL